MRWISFTLALLVSTGSSHHLLSAEEKNTFDLTLRSRVPADAESGLYHHQFEEQKWTPTETAIIVCDMWDLHHCYNAVQRETEMAPRMNRLLKQARNSGATIIHSPSSCMAFYEDHPARQRAKSIVKVANLPEKLVSGVTKFLPRNEASIPSIKPMVAKTTILFNMPSGPKNSKRKGSTCVLRGLVKPTCSPSITISISLATTAKKSGRFWKETNSKM